MSYKVGIVGAGFAGITLAQELAGASRIEVELIDRRNHHLFQPLLYQVAMAGLNPSDIAIPIRKLFAKVKNVQVLLGEVKDVNISKKQVCMDGQWRRYDKLVLACGAKHDYFGNSQWEPLAPGLKTIEQATEIRRRVLTAFEMAEKCEDDKEREAYLRFCVVGGGPTGVELAGAIREMATVTLKEDYKQADLSKTEVFLIEAGDRVLASFHPNSSKQAEKSLEELGVTVLKGEPARNLSVDGLEVGNQKIDARTTLWAAGVKPSSLVNCMQVSQHSSGRVKIEKDLSVPGHPDVFCLGDMAYLENDTGEGLPGMAPVALQQGKHLAKNLKADLEGRDRQPFHYFDKGQMATIGRSRAVAETAGRQFSGLPAWLAWVFIHVLYLLRFRNKMFVLMQWIWGYFSFGRGARLIVQKKWRFYGGEDIQYLGSENESNNEKQA